MYVYNYLCIQCNINSLMDRMSLDKPTVLTVISCNGQILHTLLTLVHTCKGTVFAHPGADPGRLTFIRASGYHSQGCEGHELWFHAEALLIPRSETWSTAECQHARKAAVHQPSMSSAHGALPN